MYGEHVSPFWQWLSRKHVWHWDRVFDATYSNGSTHAHQNAATNMREEPRFGTARVRGQQVVVWW